MLAPAELEQLDEATLREALKKIRAKKRAQAEIEARPPLPPYVAPDDPADKLNYEYGMELAFRPAGDPDRLSKEQLAPVFFMRASDAVKHRSMYFRPSALQMMFTGAIKRWAPHIGATNHTETMCGCSGSEIEFPSPILTRLSQVEWYYDRIRAVADSIGAKVENERKNSGGGHLHISPHGGPQRNWKDDEKFSVLMAMIEEPWIGWVFNDPDDRSTATSPIKSVINAMWGWQADLNDSWWDALDLDGTTAIRWNSGAKGTIEFRCFGAPHNREEQLLHVKFVDRYVADVLKNRKRKLTKKTPPPDLPYLFPQELQDLKFGFCNEAFNKRLVSIGLNPLDYLPFVERNMKKRFDNGWPRN